jgi:hypothetical protein
MAYARKTPKNGKGKITKEETPVGPPEVMKVDELEAARFAALDAELRNHLQMIRILDLEHTKAEHDMREYVTSHQNSQAQRVTQKQFYETQVGLKKKEYQEFVTGLGKKYGLDPAKMAIDPETRTIRDLTTETQS